MVANVLIYGITDVGLDTFDCFHYDKNKKIRILARYNGFGDEALIYGTQVYEYYKVFSKYN